MPSQKPFLLYANCDVQGSKASFLVLSRQIPHDFILLEVPPVLELVGIRELRGIDQITKYIENFQYVLDLEIWLLNYRH